MISKCRVAAWRSKNVKTIYRFSFLAKAHNPLKIVLQPLWEPTLKVRITALNQCIWPLFPHRESGRKTVPKHNAVFSVFNSALIDLLASFRAAAFSTRTTVNPIVVNKSFLDCLRQALSESRGKDVKECNNVRHRHSQPLFNKRQTLFDHCLGGTSTYRFIFILCLERLSS